MELRAVGGGTAPGFVNSPVLEGAAPGFVNSLSPQDTGGGKGCEPARLGGIVVIDAGTLA